MKVLFDSADRYLENSDWKDLALIKFCLFSIGALAGLHIAEKYRKAAAAVASAIFVVTYIPLMAKYFRILFDKNQ